MEYVNTKIRLDDVSKYKDKNPIGMMLSGVLTAIIEGSQDYIDFKKQFSRLFDNDDSEVRKELNKLGAKVEIYLQKQFPDGTKVKFGVNPPHFTELLKSFDTTVDDGIETKAEDKGDGMQRAIMLAIIQAFADYRKSQSGGGSFLFLIDEAELHLHPSAQRSLKRALFDICTTDQVFVNTHSSVLVVENNEHQRIFRVEKHDRITSIIPIGEDEKPYIIYELLGGSPADLLLPKNFLVVEGKCELEFLTRVIRRLYQDKPVIQIVQVNGDLKQSERSINAIEQIFKPLEKSLYKEKTVLLFDLPTNPTLLTQFLGRHPYLNTNNQAFKLSVGNIEEYYPNCNSWRKTQSEVNGMSSHQKVNLAKQVGEQITQQQFDTEMKIVSDALKRCWELAYN